jgi:hypothetical protein
VGAASPAVQSVWPISAGAATTGSPRFTTDDRRQLRLERGDQRGAPLRPRPSGPGPRLRRLRALGARRRGLAEGRDGDFFVFELDGAGRY